MILTEYIFRIIAKELRASGITGYNSLGPEEVSYPFVVYSAVSLTPFFAVDINIEQLKVRFKIYAKSYNIQDVIDIMKELEILFNRTTYDFDEPEYGATSMCSVKITESLGKDEEGFGTGIVDYKFSAWREKDNTPVDVWSSSSSSTSSSSSES